MSPPRQSERPSPGHTKLVVAVWHPFSGWCAPGALARAIGERWPELQLVHLPDYRRLAEELPDAHIFVGASLRPEQFRQARKLAWIHSTATGVSQLMYPELRQSGVLLTNPRGIFSVPVAEHTMGLILALARNFPDSVRYQDRGRWAQQELWDQPQQLSEVQGKLLLILGYGSIGRELGKLAVAFGLRVWGVTRSGRGDRSHAERILPAGQLADALPHADYVVLAAPETPESRGLIGEMELAKMKRGSRLINVARGSLVDESALLNALGGGALGGAALDVAAEEPLPPDSPLWRVPRLFITPHTSGLSDRLWPRQTELLLDLLGEWFAGKELSNQVEVSRGY